MIAALLLLATLLLPLSPAPAAPPAPVRRVAAVFSGPVNDAGWTASAHAGLTELGKRRGFSLAYTENVKPADADQVFRDYAKAGFDVVLGHGFEWSEAIVKAARRFPGTRFIQTNGSAGDIPNLHTATFSAGEGGYFVGLTAASITRSGKVVYIAGTSFPILAQQIKMTRQAAVDLGRKVEVGASYVGSWHGDAARAKELAAAAIESGADVLILEADAADPGTIQAAREAARKGRFVRVISWVRDKHHLAPELVIGGWEERVPRLIEYCLDRIGSGRPGGHFALGLHEEAVALNPFYGLVAPEVEKLVRDALARYFKDPSSIPTLEVRKDL